MSHTIRNTQRAQQMSERVMQSLAQAQRKYAAGCADDRQVLSVSTKFAWTTCWTCSMNLKHELGLDHPLDWLCKDQ